MNKYIVFINLDNILRDKYLESYLKDGYTLIYSDETSLGFRLGEPKYEEEVELNYIKGTIQIIKRMRLKKVIAMDITEEIAKSTGNITTDNWYTKVIRHKAMKELVNSI